MKKIVFTVLVLMMVTAMVFGDELELPLNCIPSVEWANNSTSVGKVQFSMGVYMGFMIGLTTAYGSEGLFMRIIELAGVKFDMQDAANLANDIDEYAEWDEPLLSIVTTVFTYLLMEKPEFEELMSRLMVVMKEQK